ncbi:MAG TPA: Dabb family protein [Candidatus Dormibacteraeota bacterium]|nr:Dabb family protein [Candidatus Dormibacteraeota bacterium]
MKLHFRHGILALTTLLASFALLAAGYALGSNRYGQPKTIIHVVEVQWRPGVTDAQKQQVLDGIRNMAAQIPGIENIWLKPARLEPRDFSTAFAIEFKDRAAADAYAESAAHNAFDKMYVPLRANSLSIQVTN